jgi:hypothetical protein
MKRLAIVMSILLVIAFVSAVTADGLKQFEVARRSHHRKRLRRRAERVDSGHEPPDRHEQDPRAITMIITSDVDPHSCPQRLAGLDTDLAIRDVLRHRLGQSHQAAMQRTERQRGIPGRRQEELARRRHLGHWIKYTEPGFGNGAGCTNANTLGNWYPC